MKRIEDMEKMSLDELMNIAHDEGVKLPEGLQERIAARMPSAKTVVFRPVHKALAIAASLAIVAAAGFALADGLRQPKDTFTTPEEAYAMLGQTFSTISGKVDSGLEKTRELKSSLEHTREIIYK